MNEFKEFYVKPQVLSDRSVAHDVFFQWDRMSTPVEIYNAVDAEDAAAVVDALNAALHAGGH